MDIREEVVPQYGDQPTQQPDNERRKVQRVVYHVILNHLRPAAHHKEFHNVAATLQIPITVHSHKDIRPLIEVIKNVFQS